MIEIDGSPQHFALFLQLKGDGVRRFGSIKSYNPERFSARDRFSANP